MARVNDLADLLVEELRTVLGAEQELARVLGRFAVEVEDRQLENAFRRHLAETEEHMKNVESALRIMGSEPLAGESPAVAGLRAEHDAALAALDPQSPAAIRDLVYAGSAARAELYELGSYEAIVAKAKLLGEDDLAELLVGNLEEDRSAAEEAMHVAERLAREVADAPAVSTA